MEQVQFRYWRTFQLPWLESIGVLMYSSMIASTSSQSTPPAVTRSGPWICSNSSLTTSPQVSPVTAVPASGLMVRVAVRSDPRDSRYSAPSATPSATVTVCSPMSQLNDADPSAVQLNGPMSTRWFACRTWKSGAAVRRDSVASA